MRFLAYNQYVHKMLHRWGPNVKEMMAIKKYLATQNVSFNHPPWVRYNIHSISRNLKTVQHLETLRSHHTVYLLLNKTIEKSAAGRQRKTRK
jgi:protein Jumonji